MSASPDVVAAAVAQVEQGFAAFALRANAKVPITEHGFKNATTNPDWIRTQLQAPPAGNYGIVWPEDRPDPVVVFDLDDGGGAERPWQDRLLELMARLGPLPRTKATTTPSGGRHAFYRWPAGVPIPPGDELFGFTVRWPGRGYLVGPGSTINGVPYVPGPEQAIAELPTPWVVAAATEHASRPVQAGQIVIGGGFELPAQIPSGRRYATVRDYLASRYNSGLTNAELWELVRTQVAPRFATPKTEQELRGDFERAIAKMADRLGEPRRAGRQAPVPTGPIEDAPLSSFTSAPIEWLWPGWLARGVVTMFDGNPGVAKSTVVADLIARLTRILVWPDGTPVPAIGRVLYVTTEDDPGKVLRPRIEVAGGDPELVRFVTTEVVYPGAARPFHELVLRRAGEVGGLALVVLDPLFSHIDASIRTIADAEMRRGVMNPLGDTAEAANVAILVVRHFNKDTTTSALNRGAGSLGGITGAARAVWTATVDPESDNDETKAVGVTKQNYALKPKAWRYRVVTKVPEGWLTGGVSAIEWLGEAPVSIDAMLTEDPNTKEAAPVLAAFLADGPKGAQACLDHMRSKRFGRAATKSAKARLGVTSTKTGMTGGWVWSLPMDPDEAIVSPEGVDASDEPTPSKGSIDEQTDPFEGDEGTQAVPSPRAYAREAPAPSASSDSSDSSKGSKETKGLGLPAPAPAPAPAHASTHTGAHEADPLPGQTSWCLAFDAHQTRHRDVSSDPWCEVCTPRQESP